MGIGSTLYDVSANPNLPEMTGWETNQTIAETIIQYALDLAESLEAGKSTIDDAEIETILQYYEINGLKTLIQTALTNDVSNGGYGLDTQDELDLWNRARDREAINAQMAVDEAKRNYSMSAFSMPSGALTQAMERANGVAIEKNSSVNRDLAIKKADLYWEGKKFTLTLGVTLEQLLLAIGDAKGKIRTQLDGVILETQARIIAAALSMMNMNASIGNHFSRSQSQSASASSSRSISYSAQDSYNVNYNHNYNE